MFRLHKTYFLFTVLLFLIELYISFYVHDNFVRPYFGDFLVVILVYCFVKAFVTVSVNRAAVAVLLFSYIVETLQYFKITVLLGLKNSKLANIIIGNSFSWSDIVSYTLGIGLVLIVEKFVSGKGKAEDSVTH